jgi:hypothetical protein
LDEEAVFFGEKTQSIILSRVLILHVIPDVILEDDIRDGATVNTLLDQTIRFEVDGSDIQVFGQTQIETVTVISTDLLADNGVVHAIDNVIAGDFAFEDFFNEFCDPDLPNFDPMTFFLSLRLR